MHEMTLAESVLGIIENAGREQGFDRVSALTLEIGELAGVELDALRFCLGVVLEHSIASGATIEWSIVPGSGFCLDCGRKVAMNTLYAPCAICGGPHVEATDGLQMRLRDLRVH